MTVRWLYWIHVKNMVLLPLMIGLCYGCGQFLGQRWLSQHVGRFLTRLLEYSGSTRGAITAAVVAV